MKTQNRIGLMFAALTAAGLSVLCASDAEAQADVRLIRPNVMVLLDTSGSMEWRNGVENNQCFGGDGGTCNQCVLPGGGTTSICSPTCPVDQRRNRWTTALEVLTGDIGNFSCREVARTDNTQFSYDFNYPVPYHEPLSNGVPLWAAGAVQGQGLLDSYRESLRFGLMTFDNDFGIGLGPNDGQYSYGSNRGYRASGCVDAPVQVNVGIRRESASMVTDNVPGGLVSVGSPSADSTLLSQINATIQANLTGFRNPLNSLITSGPRPYGGTPVAGMLEDAYHYWTNHVDVRSPTGGAAGDPYFNCRARYNVLITDGKPNMDFGVSEPGGPVCDEAAGLCPYQHPTRTAMEMAATGGGSAPGVKTWVVAFNAADPATTSILGAIATAGGGSLITANDSATLRGGLDRLFTSFSQGTTTRTAPAFGGSSGSASSSASYQFNTSFAISGTATWEGVLERRRTVCEGSPPAPVEKAFDATQDDFGALLRLSARNAAGRGWGPRKLWSYVPTTFSTVPQLLGVVRASVSGDFTTALDSGLSPWTTGSATGGQRDATLAWLRGEPGTSRENTPLGDIYHSNPLIVSGPSVSLPDQSYAAFRARPLAAAGARRVPVTIATRETVLYVGSNDGILHAFDADTGEEMWGFVPPMLMPTLGQRTTGTRMWGFDGTPVSRDVIFSRNAGAPASGTDWRSVLVVGLREAAGGYMGLDVTDPRRPKFLWQFSDADLRSSTGTPMIATIRTTWPSGTLNERAVALLPGGSGAPAVTCTPTANVRPAPARSAVRWPGAGGTPRSAVRCWNGRSGQFVYVIDMETGLTIRKLGTGAGGLQPTGSPIIGSFAGHLAGEGSVTTRGYVGDADGGLWRLDMTVANPSSWSLDQMYDVFYDSAYNAGQPLISQPIVTVDRNGDTLIALGSGDVDLLEGTEANRVVMIREHDPDPANPTNPVDVTTHWMLRNNTNPDRGLLNGERLTGPLSLFNGVLYFGTFVPSSSTDACEFGFSRLWGVDQAQLDLTTVAGPNGLPLARLDIDGDPSTTADVVRVTRDLAGNGTLADDVNSVLFGVGVARRPACPSVSSVADPFFGGTRAFVNGIEGGDYRLVIQTGRGGVSAGGGGAQRTNVVTRRLASPSIEVRLESWATVFE
ncbi:MAG: PilC/PilY family type IV pilus protein [Deltaproteobacteria bacterium]|nr:PilC/PilY family type IV pilus protein [Deltaproteobacteria bacterium]